MADEKTTPAKRTTKAAEKKEPTLVEDLAGNTEATELQSKLKRLDEVVARRNELESAKQELDMLDMEEKQLRKDVLKAVEDRLNSGKWS